MSGDAQTTPASKVRLTIDGKEIAGSGMDPNAFGDPADFGSGAFVVEIIGPDGKVHYRRPPCHADVTEAMRTPGYAVRVVAKRDAE